MFVGNISYRLSNSNSVREQGLAMLEVAGAMVILLPLLLVAVGVAIMLHDQAVYRGVPSEVIRSVAKPLMQYGEMGAGSVFTISEKQAKSVAVEMVKRMEQSLAGQAIAMNQPSFKGCVWLVRVNSVTGLATGIAETTCHEAGAAGAQLTFSAELRKAFSEQIGVPLLDGSGHYASSVVLVGAKVTAKSEKKIIGVDTPDLEHGVVQSPRGEVTI